MKILLIVPKFVQKFGDFYHFPLGMAYISAALKQAGHEVHGLDCNRHREPPEELVARAVAEFGPDICGAGALSPYIPEVAAIFSVARRVKPSIINLVGGGVLSGDPEAAPFLMDIDVGVIGEGEITVVDLCAALEEGRDLTTVPGIICRNGAGAFARTAERDAIADLGTIVWPDFEGFGYGDALPYQRVTDHQQFHVLDAPRAITMISGRSCPYRCTFCFHPSGKVYRERPLDDFFAELDDLVARYNINMLTIVDELFSLRKSRIIEFCNRIKPYNLFWSIQLHVNCADEEILDRLRDAGCCYISYGIESMSQEVLYSMKKKSKVERINTVLANTYAKKIMIQGNLIFGDSAESLETANESMHWWAQHRRYAIFAHRLGVFPGSPDYIEAVRDGLITDRIGFTKKQSYYSINISRMNDVNLEVLSIKLTTIRCALLKPAPWTLFEKEPVSDPVRGDLYRIAWDCPRCSQHNDYRRAVLQGSEHAYSLRLTCRCCQSRFDLRNPNAPGCDVHPDKAMWDARTAEALQALETGEERKGEAILRDVTSRAVWHYPAQILLGRRYASRGDNLMAIRHLSAGVLFNPFSSIALAAYGEFLISDGSIGLARLFLEQALGLEPENAAAKAGLDRVMNGGWSEAQQATYFPSYSDAPSPTRLTAAVPASSTGRRPKEDSEFPDIARLEQDMLQRLAGAVLTSVEPRPMLG